MVLVEGADLEDAANTLERWWVRGIVEADGILKEERIAAGCMVSTPGYESLLVGRHVLSILLKRFISSQMA